MDADGVTGYGDRDDGQSPRQFIAVSQRERLLDGMAQTVAEAGYAATSVADVLRVAGISRRTFYERFADKEDCFLAAYDAFADVCSRQVVGAFRSASTWDDGVERSIAALLAVLAAEPAFARLAVVEVLAAGPRSLTRRDATLRRVTDFIRTSGGAAPTSADPPRDLVAQAIVGGVYELIYSHIVRGEVARLPELADEILHYVFMLLGARRQQT